ncbi:hypothetical protein [Comamonas koreensis]|uniref:Uncharacterized protein n=1 Tax=Comamonas koreensis TaxID=160825 RepID=A0AAW4XRH6_9BURK|nr:hypothetical protein [Comamonas koreensis]MCD2163514.1 hypothetical protein [Comamonas koreensis]
MNPQSLRNPMIALATAIYNVRPPVLKGMKIDNESLGIEVVRLEVELTPELVKAWGDACSPSADSKGQMSSPSVGDKWAGIRGTGWKDKGGSGLAPILVALTDQAAERVNAEVTNVLDKLDSASAGIQEVSHVYNLGPLWLTYREQVKEKIRQRVEQSIAHEVAGNLLTDHSAG